VSEARSITELSPRPELAKYELVEEVGHGGMATVYRALDRRLGREVAVKVIHRHLRDNREVAARFTAEARAVAKLRHPNIVEVYDVSDEAESERYLVVELVRGTTLRKLLTEQGHLPAEIAAIIGVAIANALGHAHEQGVVHRDIKPENVLVGQAMGDPGDRISSSEPLIKITDFGIAKILDAQGVTSTGQVLGSPAHMSPEQIEGGDVSARSDVFGVGVLLYECMVGQLPFDGRNPAQVLRRVLDGSYLAAERARPTVGARFSRIIDRALAHKPVDRYASAAELEQALLRELARMDFSEPQRELADFLRMPAEYRVRLETRIVERLGKLGREAQAARNVPEAAYCFNRALGFRPNDPGLLRAVTGLNRAQRWRARTRRLSIGAALGAVLGLLAYAVGPKLGAPSRASQPASALIAPSPRLASSSVRLAAQPTAHPEPKPSSSGASVGTEGSAAPRTVHRPAVKTEGVLYRTVQVLIPGVSAGTVTIDGQQVGQHGVKRELVVGRTYLFGFVPPNSNCCVGSQLAVEIPRGEGVFSVTGSIKLRNAVITATGAPESSVLSCGMWGKTVTPGSVSVPMDQPEHSGTCNVIPPPSTGIPARTRPVTIRPGQVIDLWP
jgi:tRNA A-37 threonylcarbamoyl transferase component Bud32